MFYSIIFVFFFLFFLVVSEYIFIFFNSVQFQVVFKVYNAFVNKQTISRKFQSHLSATRNNGCTCYLELFGDCA
ncbi:hypothetical protein K450DRAFT_244485 [Umbelopsis ramanniana AG]|uniref:Uncharacterized protein n=1 Tax=Umbelopsis ramanniana AG TaxID=1314678 RepID=A0AAD5E7Y7_UMBRA|nr:uncharacterized protein K450DRAFT_244485 [Umbelopsis ramanniana AG]KAI8578991.1 hypothetical protein K450DRAFT_244485 [Umbelopsis ramanniana AG]